MDFYVPSRITNGQGLSQDDVIDPEIGPIFTPVCSTTPNTLNTGLNLSRD